MPLVHDTETPVVLRLNRDLARTVKRGHPWIFADSLRDLPQSKSGSPAVLLDNRKGQPLAVGFYDPASPLAFRVCDSNGTATLDDRWAEKRLRAAFALRETLFDRTTTGYRMLNGEGDRTPGLVVDVYDSSAVIKLDGAGPRGFWNTAGIAAWLADARGLQQVYERVKERSGGGRILHGPEPTEPVRFLEHGLQFTADIVKGQKTGFFLDQRENRQAIRRLAKNRTVLNLFGYTGGFSIAAGRGFAKHVTTVDLAKPAIETSIEHWRLNELPSLAHEAIASDAFEFLDDATQNGRRWDMVVMDPPSFAPNQESIAKAMVAYRKMIRAGAAVTHKGGILAVASCSSHVDLSMFLRVCEEGLSEARCRGTMLGIHDQPADHPTPLVLPEFRYLKFVIMRVE